jgi:DNA invertase Pin-like site-specific DNA recombinase
MVAKTRGDSVIYGYMRVSTVDQSLALQKDALTKAGAEVIYSDKISGTKFDREGLQKLVKVLRPGDTVIVYKLDRLGRSLKDLIRITEWFRKNKIEFVSLQESVDTTTSFGRLMFNMLAMLAEFERDLISDRTKAGLAAARERGKIGGRKPTGLKETIKQQLARGLHYADVAKAHDVSRQYVYKIMKGKV